MALLLLHYAYTTKNGRAIIVTPFKNQSGLIYEEIIKISADSDDVQNAIARKVTSPQHEFNFKNGSTIRFFSSGVKSGGKADITRGQEAHIIVLDEMDYMGQEDLVALYAMLQQTDENQPDKLLIAASTPTGKQELFWKWCVNKENGFTEFYFPSYCNQFFSKEVEDEFRIEYSEMQFRHEIEADWGENAEGVYPRRFLDKAFVDPPWDYKPEASLSPKSFYTIGVDWNKYQAGTNIVVLEVCADDYPDAKFRNRIKLVYREEVDRDEFTYTRAMDRIIYLNKIFKPKHIYVDRGYGEVQIETLHKYGMQHPNTNLRQIVKGIGFKESVEVPDPFTKQKIKKEMKPFMVENLRRTLERGELLIPDTDDHLYSELIGYIVERISGAGVPVFGASGSAGDNVHDALALACLAIYQNYGDLMMISFATSPVSISNEVFLPLQKKASDNDIIESKFGSTSAPVRIQRPMSDSRGKSSRPIRRKMF